MLNLTTSKTIRNRAAKQGTPIRDYDVFHDLLTDVLQAAGLQGPVRELADMRYDGAPKTDTSNRTCDRQELNKRDDMNVY